MARSAQIVIDLIVRNAGATKELDKAAGKFGKFQQGMSKAAAPAAGVIAAIGGIAAAAGKAASDTQQAFGGLDAVFGKNSGVVKKWAAEAATAVGLSASQYAELAAGIGAQLKNLGVPLDQVASKTNDLVTVGADLAATYGGSTSDAVAALGAALRGEADPAERYGLALSQTAVKARMAAEGTAKLTGKAAQQAKITALLGLVTEQAGGAVGQFAREQDSAAGSAQVAQAQWANALSTLGTVLLPIMAQGAQRMAALGSVVQANAGAFQVLAVVVASVAAAILAANVGISVYSTITKVIPALTKAWAAGQWLLNAALTANPIGLVIVAIAALVIGIILLWKKSETFRTVIMAVWAAIKTGWSVVVAAFQAGVAWVVQAWAKVVAAVTAAWAGIVAVASAIGGFFRAVWAVVALAAQTAWALIVAVVTAVVARVVAFATVVSYPYVQAFRLIAAVAGVVFQLVRIAFQVTVAVARAVALSIRLAFVLAWNAIKAGATIAWNAIKAAIQRLLAPARAVATAARAVFVAGWNAIKSAASSMASAVSSRIQALLGPARSVASGARAAFAAAWNAIKSAATSMSSAIRSAVSKISEPVRSVASAVKGTLTSAFNSLKSAGSSAANAIASPFRSLAGTVNNVISRVQSLVAALKRIKVPSIKLPGSGGGGSARAAMGVSSLRSGEDHLSARAPGLFTGGGGGPRSSGASVVSITVNGALDPDAVARQIEKILAGAGKRRSGVTMAQRAGSVAAA